MLNFLFFSKNVLLGASPHPFYQHPPGPPKCAHKTSKTSFRTSNPPKKWFLDGFRPFGTFLKKSKNQKKIRNFSIFFEKIEKSRNLRAKIFKNLGQKKLQKGGKYFFRGPRTHAKKILGDPGLMVFNAEFYGLQNGVGRFPRFYFAQMGIKFA